MSVSKEAIEAFALAFWPVNAVSKMESCGGDIANALEAALPFLSIAVEGKVKPLEWTQGDEDPGYHFAQSSIGNYAITDFPVVGDDQLTVRLLGTSQYGTWFRTLDEAKAAAQSDYETRILSALISSPGKDGGQEVERDFPAEFEAWWETYRHKNREPADYSVKKQIAFDAFYFAARPQPASTALVEAAGFVKAAMVALEGYEEDCGEPLPDDHELGRIDDSRHSPSFRIRVGHIRRLAAALSSSTSREGESRG